MHGQLVEGDPHGAQAQGQVGLGRRREVVVRAHGDTVDEERGDPADGYQQVMPGAAVDSDVAGQGEVGALVEAGLAVAHRQRPARLVRSRTPGVQEDRAAARAGRPRRVRLDPQLDGVARAEAPGAIGRYSGGAVGRQDGPVGVIQGAEDAVEGADRGGTSVGGSGGHQGRGAVEAPVGVDPVGGGIGERPAADHLEADTHLGSVSARRRGGQGPGHDDVVEVRLGLSAEQCGPPGGAGLHIAPDLGWRQRPLQQDEVVDVEGVERVRRRTGRARRRGDQQVGRGGVQRERAHAGQAAVGVDRDRPDAVIGDGDVLPSVGDRDAVQRPARGRAEGPDPADIDDLEALDLLLLGRREANGHAGGEPAVARPQPRHQRP